MRDVRIAVMGVGETPMRMADAEALLVGHKLSKPMPIEAATHRPCHDAVDPYERSSCIGGLSGGTLPAP